MQSLVSWFSGGIVAISLALAMFVVGDEEKISLDKVPKPVLDAVRTRFQSANLTSAGRETKDARLLYEITINLGEQTIDVTLTPEGQIEVIEKQIAFRDLSTAAARILEIRYPNAVYKIVEEVIEVERKEEKLTFYEVLIETADKNLLEVQLNVDGKIINQENKGSGDESEEDSEKDTGEEDD